MKRKRLWWLLGSLAPLLISACAGTPNNPRVELPQQYRLPQADLATTFEKRSGRIALINEEGNVVIMDQTGSGAVKITKDAAVQPATGQLAMAYSLPVWSPDASQVAFIEVTAQRSSASRIIEYGADAVQVLRGERSYTVEQTEEGQSVQLAPGTTGIERQPSRIIIERGSDSGDPVSAAIYVAHADGKSPLQEVYLADKGVVGYLDWSPDSSQLAFLSQATEDEVALNVVTKDGASMRKVAEGATAAWHWNPDGKTLLAKVDRPSGDGEADLSLYDVQAASTADSKPVAAIASNANLPFRSPAFSPDGSMMLLTVKSDGKNYLAVADRQGTVRRKLAEVNGNISFSWSPVEPKVAYILQEQSQSQDSPAGSVATSPEQLGGALHVVDVNTGEDRVLSQQPVMGFFWAPDGGRIAAFSPVRPSDITKDFPGMDLTSSSPNFVLMLQTIDVNTRGFRQLFYFEPTTAFRAVLSQFDRFSRSMTIWSPDSKRLVFPVIYSNAQTSYNLVLETEATGSIEPRVVSQGTLAVWSPK